VSDYFSPTLLCSSLSQRRRAGRQRAPREQTGSSGNNAWHGATVAGRLDAIDGQMGWAKRAARGTTRFRPAQARPDTHKDGPGRHSPLWRAMLGPLPRHVGCHGHDPFKWMTRFGPLYLSLHIKISYVCDCLNILYLNIGQYMTTCICVSLYVC
jgi:hypothetical protein